MLSTSFDRLVIVAMMLLASTMVTFSELAQHPDADTLLPAVMSTQRVTWYFWGQNRLGNLWPLVASPIADIHLNFAIQEFLKACMAALSPLFLVQLLRPSVNVPAAYAAGLLGLFGTLEPSVVKQFWLETQPYGTSITLVAAATWVGARGELSVRLRSLAVFALVLVATWVNIGIVLVTVPVFGLFLVVDRTWHHAGMLACSLVCYALVTIHCKFFPGPPGYASLQLSWAGFEALAKTTRQSLMTGPVLALVAAFAVAGAIAIRVASGRPVFRRTLLLIAACAGTMLITACLTWFAANEYSSRYLCLPLALMFGAASIAVADVAAALLRPAPTLRVLASVGICAAALGVIFRGAKPSLAVPQIQPAYADLADRAVQEQASFLAGDYWTVWPAVFEANARMRPHRVYGLAYRGSEVMTQIEAAAVPGAVLVCTSATARDCTSTIRSDLGRNEIAGRPIDVAFELVRSGSYGADARPYVVLRVRPL